MTVKKRLARSNIVMIIIPVLAAGVLLLIGSIAALWVLENVYLPQLGLSLKQLHQAGEQLEHLFSGSKALVLVYAAAAAAVLLLTVVLTNLWLTRSLFCRISEPLDELTAGVARIRDGDLDSPIAYADDDEFKAACDAVDEMAARLKASLVEQQREQQQKRELIAGMSHDLKSPLTSIRAYTEALLDGVAKDDLSRERYLRTVRAKEGDIEAMVERLFEFAKADAGEYPVQPEPLPLQQTVRGFVGDAPDVSVSIPVGLTVTADRELMRRITTNITDNSRRHGGRADIHIDISAEKVGSSVALTFADNGKGVPKEQLPKLFDLFYRGDAARTEPSSGSGIGLAAVKTAAKAMGGDVKAELCENGGLKITVTLPAWEDYNG